MTRPSLITVTDEAVITLMLTIATSDTPNSVKSGLVRPVSMVIIAKMVISEINWVMDTSQSARNRTHYKMIEVTRTTRMA
jgi:hypothetical protein